MCSIFIVAPHPYDRMRSKLFNFFFPLVFVISLYAKILEAEIIFFFHRNLRRERMSLSIYCMRSCVDRRLRFRLGSRSVLLSLSTCERDYIGHVARRFGERYVECTVDFLTVRLFVIVRARTRDEYIVRVSGVCVCVCSVWSIEQFSSVEVCICIYIRTRLSRCVSVSAYFDDRARIRRSPIWNCQEIYKIEQVPQF